MRYERWSIIGFIGLTIYVIYSIFMEDWMVFDCIIYPVWVCGIVSTFVKIHDINKI